MQCPQCLREYTSGETICRRDGTPLAPPTLFDGVESPGDDEDPEVGTVLGQQYRLTAVIGEGGMGLIYRAHQENVGRDVAVKVLRARFAKDENVVLRFENEAKIISQLRHPNTIRLYDYQRMPNGGFFIVTEYLRGQSLIELLRSQGALPPIRAMSIAEQICASLAEAHEVGIIHRDLKPANIFLDRIGADDLVKVLDFGIAKLLQGALVKTQANLLMGTPAYMSPEQIKGQPADARSDVYSLGVLTYQMLTGRTPFVADNQVALLLKQVNDPPPRFAVAAPHLKNIHSEIERLVLEMLSKAPSRRPQSVTTVRDRLRQIARLIDLETAPRTASGRAVLTEDGLPLPTSDAAMRAPLTSLDTGDLAVPASEWPTETAGAPSLAMLEAQRAAVVTTHPLPVVEAVAEATRVTRPTAPVDPIERADRATEPPVSVRIDAPVEAKDEELWMPLEEDGELAIRRVSANNTSDLEIPVPPDVQAAAAAAMGRPKVQTPPPMAARAPEPPAPEPSPARSASPPRMPIAIFPSPEDLAQRAAAAARADRDIVPVAMPAPWRPSREPIALLAEPSSALDPLRWPSTEPSELPVRDSRALVPHASARARFGEPSALARPAPRAPDRAASEPQAEMFLDDRSTASAVFKSPLLASHRLAIWGAVFAALALLLILGMWMFAPIQVRSTDDPILEPDVEPLPKGTTLPAPAPEPEKAPEQVAPPPAQEPPPAPPPVEEQPAPRKAPAPAAAAPKKAVPKKPKAAPEKPIEAKPPEPTVPESAAPAAQEEEPEEQPPSEPIELEIEGGAEDLK